jgi:hypothetical protein
MITDGEPTAHMPALGEDILVDYVGNQRRRP